MSIYKSVLQVIHVSKCHKKIQDTGQVTGKDNMQVIWDITNRKSNGIHQNQHAIICTKKRCYNDSKYESHFYNFF